jgi:hypothetical protein
MAKAIILSNYFSIVDELNEMGFDVTEFIVFLTNYKNN